MEQEEEQEVKHGNRTCDVRFLDLRGSKVGGGEEMPVSVRDGMTWRNKAKQRKSTSADG